MFLVKSLNKISEKGLSRFPEESYHLDKDAKNPHAFLLRSFNLHDAPIPDTLLAVGRAGVGVNNIPVKTMTEKRGGCF